MTVENYNQCVDEFSDGVFRFILKNIRDEEKAKDIVQETFAKLWVKAKDISHLKAKSYLFTTAYHTMIDMVRKEKRIADFEYVNEINYSYSDNYSGLSEVLEEGLNRLPEVQKSVLLLRDYEGYSYDEIAEITDLSESQVKVYIYRGRLALRKFIGNIEAVI